MHAGRFLAWEAFLELLDVHHVALVGLAVLGRVAEDGGDDRLKRREDAILTQVLVDLQLDLLVDLNRLFYHSIHPYQTQLS